MVGASGEGLKLRVYRTNRQKTVDSVGPVSGSWSGPAQGTPSGLLKSVMLAALCYTAVVISSPHASTYTVVCGQQVACSTYTPHSSQLAID